MYLPNGKYFIIFSFYFSFCCCLHVQKVIKSWKNCEKQWQQQRRGEKNCFSDRNCDNNAYNCCLDVSFSLQDILLFFFLLSHERLFYTLSCCYLYFCKWFLWYLWSVFHHNDFNTLVITHTYTHMWKDESCNCGERPSRNYTDGRTTTTTHNTIVW